MDNLTHTLFGATLARTPLGARDAARRRRSSGLERTRHRHRHDGGRRRSATSNGTGARRTGRSGSWSDSALSSRDRAGAGRAGACSTATGRRHRASVRIARRCVSIVGVLCHVLMDLPTSYGTRLLSPFDWHWYAVRPDADHRHLSAGGARRCASGSGRLVGGAESRCIALCFMALNYGVRTAAHRRRSSRGRALFGRYLARALCIGPAPSGPPIVDRWPIHDPAVVTARRAGASRDRRDCRLSLAVPMAGHRSAVDRYRRATST